MACDSVATARAKVSALSYQQTVALLKLLYPAPDFVAEGPFMFSLRVGSNTAQVTNDNNQPEIRVSNWNRDIASALAFQDEMTGKLSKAALALIAKALQSKANVTKSEYINDGRGLLLTLTTR